ncbi:uncharacterized protein A1O9_12464 [Exophiala aquamarina CBS 119918]|uniref:NAD-dependent epimerase/dehydratase domain-containing protein n=1 Tax=Exophiala aquamarina CBS 119918 TaxID=1182545 RepID=A0A072NVW7_9EURO|nr:uncharacterized protein A1O9_12464 [Exophiala aquamarina CBS 119918]KEF51547.1 hypothetical protein A1O9_12464 [Exophiala aquamarina CBS 119918]
MGDKRHDVSVEKLLLTGTTGYIGFKTLLIALERGYWVRLIVRKESNLNDLRAKHELVAKASEQKRLEFVVISDFTDAVSIERALQGITAIIHLASPLAKADSDFEKNIVDPAVLMVNTILESAAKVLTVQRVVITSSCVTLIPFEWNFNPDSETLYTAQNLNSNPTKPYTNAMEAYWASKALARIATRDFTANQKPHFDYVNLLPSVVIGPDERIPIDGHVDELLSGARAAVLAPALTSDLNSAFPYVGVPVHVADVARAHVDAVNANLIPGDTEYILSSDTPEGVEWDRDVSNAAQKYFAAEVSNGVLPLKGALQTIKWRIDAMSTEEAFGWKFTSFEETARQLIAQYIQLKGNQTVGSKGK